MLEDFYDYLVSLGLSEYTKSGRKSTVYSYCNRIELVCKNENIPISQLAKDIEAMKKQNEISLLAKWLPSVNASNKETVRKAKKLCRMLGMSEAEYRKTLSELRAYLKLIENNLRERDYTFDYSKVPSFLL